MKTKEKQFSIQYKFAHRGAGLPAAAGTLTCLPQAGLCYPDLFCFFEFFDQGGDDFEEVAYDAVVGDFEDRRVLVFVDGGDGARRLSCPTTCWMAPLMPSAR